MASNDSSYESSNDSTDDSSDDSSEDSSDDSSEDSSGDSSEKGKLACFSVDTLIGIVWVNLLAKLVNCFCSLVSSEYFPKKLVKVVHEVNYHLRCKNLYNNTHFELILSSAEAEGIFTIFTALMIVSILKLAWLWIQCLLQTILALVLVLNQIKMYICSKHLSDLSSSWYLSKRFISV